MNTILTRPRGLQITLLTAVLIFAAGCKQQTAEQPARTDQQIANDVEAKIAAESPLNGQNIQVAVAGGVATLSGTANDDASRALAGNDAGSVEGVKTVVNNMTVQPPKQAAAVAPAVAAPPVRERRQKPRHEREVAQAAPPEPVPSPAAAPPPAPVEQSAPAPAPVEQSAPAPVARTVTIPAGTVVSVRITDALSSQSAQPNQIFHGTLAGDLVADGMVAVSHGSTVTGRVVDAKDAAHFKGSSLLSIELTQLSTRKRQIPVVTDAYSKEGAARGKNTAVKTGGGAALGAIIGALAGGGKGAAIGAVAGGGAGAGVNAVTRGQQVQIQPETLINFRLQSPITVTTSHAVGAPRSFNDNTPPAPELEQRPPQ